MALCGIRGMNVLLHCWKRSKNTDAKPTTGERLCPRELAYAVYFHNIH